MKKIAIIGGTGMTGQCAVDYAIKKGKFLFVFSAPRIKNSCVISRTLQGRSTTSFSSNPCAIKTFFIPELQLQKPFNLKDTALHLDKKTVELTFQPIRLQFHIPVNLHYFFLS